MRPNRSKAFRLIAVLTAFVTVWCIGCSGFEPLITQLLDGHAGMTCASDGSMTAAAMQDGSDQPAGVGAADAGHAGSAVTLASTAGDRGYSCGCQSCTSVSLSQLVTASVPQPAVRPYAAPFAEPSDITRQPLVPPPQLSL